MDERKIAIASVGESVSVRLGTDVTASVGVFPGLGLSSWLLSTIVRFRICEKSIKE